MPTVVAKRLRTNSDAATSVAVVVVVAVIVMPVEVVLVFVVVWWCLDAGAVFCFATPLVWHPATAGNLSYGRRRVQVEPAAATASFTLADLLLDVAVPAPAAHDLLKVSGKTPRTTSPP